MNVPRATARLQLHAQFDLRAALAQVPYYARLGVSHLYVSPLTRARSGSRHGYDVVDHGMVSPELGGEPALRELSEALHRHGMGLIADIVPNHMAASHENSWWHDVLRNGRGSAHAGFFDIDWQAPGALHGKVLAPFLAKPYGQALVDGDIVLSRDGGPGGFRIDVHGQPYPLAPGSLASGGDAAAILAAHDPSRPDGRARLHALLERQHYRLAWWRCAPEEINWRRFFEISELVGVRVEVAAVFDAVHACMLRLYEDGVIDGFRVDHIDGLADPAAYCRRLRQALDVRTPRRPAQRPGGPAYLVVEKILCGDERLDSRWPVHGTTGYDFMDQSSAVLHAADGQATLTRLWEHVAGDGLDYAGHVAQARALMLRRHFPAERAAAVRALHRLAAGDPATRDWSAAAIGRVLDEVLLAFARYRTYADRDGCAADDAAIAQAALQAARRRLQAEGDGDDAHWLPVLQQWWTGSPLSDEKREALRLAALARIQQLTPPLTAKSMEDTAFYRYGRLLSRCEVGSDPDALCLPTAQFFKAAAARGAHAMLATATHDHKRGEDVRARLAVLTEIAPYWDSTVRLWLDEHARVSADPPHPADRYMLYQTLVGAWPLGLLADDAAGLDGYAERIAAWQVKALREAKRRSSWMSPDEAYERRCTQHARALLAPGSAAARAIADMAGYIAPAGAVNGLAMAALRCTLPGVPDLYQGTEFWDLSLVDPDNRREVDYAARAASLEGLDRAPARELLAQWRSGRVKQALVHRLLRLRVRLPQVWETDALTPLPVTGDGAGRVLAYLRRAESGCAIAVVPRCCAPWILGEEGARAPVIPAQAWQDTALVLPRFCAGRPLYDAVNLREHRADADGTLALEPLLRDLPVAVLCAALG